MLSTCIHVHVAVAVFILFYLQSTFLKLAGPQLVQVHVCVCTFCMDVLSGGDV